MKKTLLFVFASALVAVVTAQQSITTSTWFGEKRTHQEGELIFEEEFDTLDFRKWQHEITLAGGGNWEFQFYWNNRTNTYVNDSILVIQPTLTEERMGEEGVRTGTLEIYGGQPSEYCTNNNWYGCSRVGDGSNILNPITSGRLRTTPSFSFKYGYVEAMIMNPCGDWIWPAFWMLPIDLEFGLWPTSGEVDIMESRGNLDYSEEGVQIGAQQVGCTLHYGIDYIMNGWEHAHYDKNSDEPYCFGYHKYAIRWEPEFITWYIDDEEVGTIDVPEGGFWELGEFEAAYPGTRNPWAGYEQNSPFDKEFYLILNVAVGGVGYFSDTATNGNGAKPWSNESPTASLDFYNAKDIWYPTWFEDGDTVNGDPTYHAMKVDYVKVWAL